MEIKERAYRLAAEQAIRDFQLQLQHNPLNADIYNSMGNALQALGHTDYAIAGYKNALKVRPDFAIATNNLVTALHSQGEFTQAEYYLRQAIHLNPGDASLHYKLAGILSGLARYDEALECCDITLQLRPGYSDAIIIKADILERKGEITESQAVLEPILAADKLNIHALLVYARLSHHTREYEAAIKELENAISRVNDSHAIMLHAALGRLYDQTQQFDKAFSHYQQGNALKDSDFDPDNHADYVMSIISVFGKNNKRTIPTSSCQSTLPIFIVGMPRSGTTLVEQILSSHPSVFGAEATVAVDPGKGILDTEKPYPHYAQLITSDALDRIANQLLGVMRQLAPGAVRVCCSERRSFLYLGLISLLFPKARVIHCTRNPIDTCLSCYFQSLAPAYSYAYNLEHLGKYYQKYKEIMDHWRHTWKVPMLEIRYEDMVVNQERLSRELLEYCGLEWNERCLTFHEQMRDVGTPSYWQVRQPIYKTSLNRWKNYQQHLQPLISALGDEACTSTS